MVCLHEQCLSVSDATAASDTAQKIGLFLSLDAAVASDTEKHCSCKQTNNNFLDAGFPKWRHFAQSGHTGHAVCLTYM
jgi:hypothetical protein